MAYNPNMYNTYGQMYGGSYGQNSYPQPMQNMQAMTAMPQQSYAQQPAVEGEIKWVDGEVGAKAYQIPAGMTKPVALWDTNDTVIYLKSMNPYGIPNPIQKIHYKMEEMTPKYIGQEQAKLESGDASPVQQRDMIGYVRKEELEAMKEELKEAIRSMQPAEARTVKSNAKSAV